MIFPAFWVKFPHFFPNGKCSPIFPGFPVRVGTMKKAIPDTIPIAHCEWALTARRCGVKKIPIRPELLLPPESTLLQLSLHLFSSFRFLLLAFYRFFSFSSPPLNLQGNIMYSFRPEGVIEDVILNT